MKISWTFLPLLALQLFDSLNAENVSKLRQSKANFVEIGDILYDNFIYHFISNIHLNILHSPI